jgi:hypothetical protein
LISNIGAILTVDHLKNAIKYHSHILIKKFPHSLENI